MSLLDVPHDVVLLRRRTEGADADGNPAQVPWGADITLPCNVHPVSSEEAANLGLTVETVRAITCRDWPADERAIIAWDGRTWDVIGEAELSSGRGLTQHYRVRIKARNPKHVEPV